ncbi:MAG TPA: hypothetical protein VFW78_00165 [Bacteroidia bacterium]|nr:hypothetical protein [Bacteroidia bacterium]
MTSRRRATIIFISVLCGTLLSAWLLMAKKGKLGDGDFFLLISNLVISLLLIFGVGYILIWRKKS